MFTLLQALQFKSKFCKELCKNNYKKELKRWKTTKEREKVYFYHY